MFVKWNRKPRKCQLFGKRGAFLISASLVESFRDNGRVKQRYIKHLASIREGFSQGKDCAAQHWQKQFWEDAQKAQDNLDLPASQREKIERALMLRVLR